MIKDSVVSAFQDHVAHCSKTKKPQLPLVIQTLWHSLQNMLMMHQQFFNVLTAGADRKHGYCAELGLFSAYFEYVVFLQSENRIKLVFFKIFDIYI